MEQGWPLIIAVTITGMVVVFIGLILLILAMVIMGAIMKAVSGKKKKEEPKLAPAPQQKPAAPVSPAPVVEAGIPGETVAAISAAVTMMTEDSAPVAIKSIRKAAPSSRSVWNLAGITENTRPF